MSTQNLIIYKFNGLYQILNELGLDLNFNVIVADNKESLNEKTKKIYNYLIISNKKYSDIHNEFVLDYTPINIFNLATQIGNLKKRINPFWGKLAGGCNINRKIPSLIQNAGFEIV